MISNELKTTLKNVIISCGISFFCAFLFTFGCASIRSRIANADNLASKAGMTRQVISTNDFNLLSFSRSSPTKSNDLHIYLEGDGYAVNGAGRASSDPTPKNPVGLKLAALDKKANVVYLARPCQFDPDATGSLCSPKYWTTHKYSKKIVKQINGTISALVKKYKAEKITLIGFSGGGTIAALIAAHRNDVKKLITVAGNLDHARHTQLLRLTPLHGSLNPPDYAGQLANIEQVHFIGQKDTVIPKSISMSYKNKINADDRLIQIVQIKGAGHGCCWEKVWQDLLTIYVNN